jgi:hypothetical protein
MARHLRRKTSIPLSSGVLAGIDRLTGSKRSRSAFIERGLRHALRDLPGRIARPDMERVNGAAERLRNGGRRETDPKQYWIW